MLNIFHKKKNISNIVDTKNIVIRIIALLIFTFSYALIYNLFLVPNHLVVNGISGLAIVIKELTGLPTAAFMYIMTAILVTIYYFIFGKKKTFNTLIGSILFTIMISVTDPIAKMITIDIDNTLILLVLTGILYGISGGMIYRAGFNTGGSDIIACIIAKYAKMTIGNASKIVNTFIIMSGAAVFGLNNAICAVIILLITTKMVDIVMLGINDSKMCFIRSKKYEEIKRVIPSKIGVGITEINNKVGILKKDIPVLLIIVPFHSYYNLKDELLKIDPEAFFTSTDCYNVLGGYKKGIIPF